MSLSEEQKKQLDIIWARYHDDLKALPSQVYFDVGWLMGLISRLESDSPTEKK